MKAKLTQIRRYWEELQEHAQCLEGTILGHISQQQKFEENLRKVRIDSSTLSYLFHIASIAKCNTQSRNSGTKERHNTSVIIKLSDAYIIIIFMVHFLKEYKNVFRH